LKERLYVLREVASKMHSNNTVEIDEDDLKIFLTKLKNDRPVDILKDTDDFLRNLFNNYNILIYNSESRKFRFFHLTIQEYLASLSYMASSEHLLLENFYDEWWLNTNIFYTGKNPENSSLISELSKLKIYPSDLLDKSTFVVHSSKVLKAAHLVSNSERKKMLKTMIGVFDTLTKELIKSIIGNSDQKFYKRTILDIILWARSFYIDHFSSKQFENCLEKIWLEIANDSNNSLTDITKYCISYDLSVSSRDAKYLLQFIDSKNTLNARWSKIVDVDITVKRLKHDRKGKPLLKLKQKAVKNKIYIAQQFNQDIGKHYKSITSIDN
ncbi:MAG: hypothetical protein ACKVIG_07540, partial [Flavobacteriales bacterium]